MTNNEGVKRWRAKQERLGMCNKCGQNAVDNSKMCRPCLNKAKITNQKQSARSKKWRIKQVEMGLCNKCGQNKVKNKKICESCLLKEKTKNQNRRNKRFENGLCTNCGKCKSVVGKKRCKICSDKNSTWYKTSNYRERHRILDKQKRRERKIRIMKYYGNQCTCCGENKLAFLCMDHIDGGGNEHRRQIGNNKNNRAGSSSTEFYKWIESNNYPDILQILCHNCNMGREINGGICPHKEKKENIIRP